MMKIYNIHVNHKIGTLLISIKSEIIKIKENGINVWNKKNF